MHLLFPVSRRSLSERREHLFPTEAVELEGFVVDDSGKKGGAFSFFFFLPPI